MITGWRSGDTERATFGGVGPSVEPLEVASFVGFEDFGDFEDFEDFEFDFEEFSAIFFELEAADVEGASAEPSVGGRTVAAIRC